VPFGPLIIHCFTHDVSELKKLAARDFEDILQVCLLYIVHVYGNLITLLSVASRALKDYCLPHMTTLSPIYCMLQHIGICLPSCASTWKLHSTSSIMSPSFWLSDCVTFLRSLACLLPLSRPIMNTMQDAGQPIAGHLVKMARQPCPPVLVVSVQKHSI
jgi:hypothetical protein